MKASRFGRWLPRGGANHPQRGTGGQGARPGLAVLVGAGLLLAALLPCTLSAAGPGVTATHEYDHLVLRGPAGTRVVLRDASERVVGKTVLRGTERPVTLRGLAKVDPMLMLVDVDGQRLPLSRLFAPVEILFVPPKRVAAGLPIVPHVRVVGRGTDQPHAGVVVDISLQCEKQLHRLGHLRSAENGVAAPVEALRVPEDASGTCELIARSAGARTSAKVSVTRGVDLVVSSDRPIYKPGDTVFARALALDLGTALPAAGLTGRFEIAVGRRVLARAPGKVSQYGVANAEIALPDSVVGGEAVVRFEAGGARSEQRITVGHYVPQKVAVSIVAEDLPRPDRPLQVQVTGEGLDGGPMAGSLLEVRWSSGSLAGRVTGVLDGQGVGSVSVPMPTGLGDSVKLSARVEAPTGGDGTAERALVVERGQLLVYGIPESGVLVPGISNRLWVVVETPDGKPASAAVTVTAGKERQTLTVDDRGFGTVALHVPRRAERVMVSAEAGKRRGVRTFGLIDEQPNALLSIDSAVVRGGEPIDITYRTAQVRGLASVELVRDGHAVVSSSFPIRDGVGRVSLPVPKSMAGRLELRGWHLDPSGHVEGDVRLLMARSIRELEVTLTADRAAYAPGEEAAIGVQVKDGNGKGVVAAVGLVAVDAGLRALGLQQPGIERALARLGTWDEPVVATPSWAREALAAAQDDERLTILASAIEMAVALGAPHKTGPDRAQAAAAAFQKAVRARADRARRDIERHFSKQRRVGERQVTWKGLVRKGVVKKNQALDPWHRPARISFRSGHCCSNQLIMLSAGVDGTFETADDVEVEVDLDLHRRCAPCVRGLGAMGFGAGGGSVHYARGGASAGEVIRPVPLRQDFPDTLAVEPALITDSSGHATWRIKMADSLTRWAIQARVSTALGGLGSAELDIAVEQPFSAAVDVPPTLTLGDTIHLPVSVTNRSGSRQPVSIVVAVGGALSGGRTLTAEIPHGETWSETVAVSAESVGDGTLQVTARGAGAADAVKRTLRVEPSGVPVFERRAGIVAAGVPVTASLAVPAGGIPGTRSTTLRLYPSPVGAALEGLESLLASPSGCFEQTSATTYPNALVLNYLDRTEQSNPKVARRAKALLRAGWERLRSFEVKGGGFSWFGDAPANQVLTAFGLMEFARMAAHVPLDEAVVERTRKWLLGQRRADGAFAPDKSYLHAESWSKIQNAALPVTAYVTWALASTGKTDDLEQTVGWLRANASSVSTDYEAALLALALSAVDPRHKSAVDARTALVARASRDDGRVWFGGDGPTATFASGRSSLVETSALAGLALLHGGDHPTELDGLLGWLRSERQPGAGWATTQATVLALETLLVEAANAPGSPNGEVRIAEKAAGAPTRASFDRTSADVVRHFNLGDAAGERQVELSLSGTGRLAWQLASVRYVSAADATSSDGPLVATAVAARSEVAIGDDVAVRVNLKTGSREVRMPTVAIGLPAGFSVDTSTIRHPAIARHEVLGRQLVLYLTHLEAGADVETQFTLTARRAGNLRPGLVKAWPYYDPEQATYREQAPLTVN